MIHVSNHACQRYRERIDPACSLAEAHERIVASAPMIETAAKFGARLVRQASGAKLILEGTAVVTVYPRGWIMGPVGGRS
jgi:hypothetical protein